MRISSVIWFDAKHLWSDGIALHLILTLNKKCRLESNAKWTEISFIVNWHFVTQWKIQRHFSLKTFFYLSHDLSFCFYYHLRMTSNAKTMYNVQSLKWRMHKSTWNRQIIKLALLFWIVTDEGRQEQSDNIFGWISFVNRSYSQLIINVEKQNTRTICNCSMSMQFA